MAYQTSTEQILLLNNLLYCDDNGAMRTFLDESNEGTTVGEFVDRVLNNGLDDNAVYSMGMTGKEYRDILQAVQKDGTLSRLVIEDVHIDSTSGAGGKSALFVDPQSNEAIVAFKGTEGGQEWADNFSGVSSTGAADGVSTDLQQSALKWYQDTVKDGGYSSITVTGHSKGGNKAKYVTLMDDSVDRCISQDGQGFSDEFMEKYADQIAANQYKISNHNTDKDYVNLLLNDVGETHYYEGTNYSDGPAGFIENHCTNAIFHFDENGNYILKETVQDPGMQEMDKMLNSYIRSVSPEARQETGAMLAKLVTTAMDGEMSGDEKLNRLIELLTGDQYRDEAGDFLGYVLKYKQEYPQLMEEVERILQESGMGDFVELVQKINDFSNSPIFDKLVRFLGEHGGTIVGIADFFGADIPQWLKDHPELWALLIQIMDAKDRANPDRDNGEDIKIPSAEQVSVFSSHHFDVSLDGLSTCQQRLADSQDALGRVAAQILVTIIPGLDYTIRKHVKSALRTCGLNAGADALRIGRMKDTLYQIIQDYRQTEERVITRINA